MRHGMTTRMPYLLVSLALTLPACADAASDAYEEGWGTEDIPGGKADGILDSAPSLAFGGTGKGYVEDEQLDVFAMSLRLGDKFTLVEKVVDGDLSPHFTLYYGASTYVASKSWSRSGATLTKTYVAAESGLYFIGVKPYRGDGAGRYELRPTCTGGPCAGEPVIVPMTIDLRAQCIDAARTCAFDKLPAFDGAVGAVRARSVFQSCLTTVTGDDGEACGEACIDPADASAKDTCDAIVADLPFYADQDAACFKVVDDCLEECADAAHGDDANAEEVWQTTIGICWDAGFNGTCDGYARDHAACGGDVAADSDEDCHNYCESTTGAWLDDLDTICTEACE